MPSYTSRVWATVQSRFLEDPTDKPCTTSRLLRKCLPKKWTHPLWGKPITYYVCKISVHDHTFAATALGEHMDRTYL